MWHELALPWQICLSLAWEAYCDGCIPIGAVVTGPDGEIISRGRNRIYENKKPEGHTNGQVLAHAEMEALYALDYDAIDPHACCLYTTTEPCPMCMGTFYMSGLRTLHYASREAFAGSVNMLGTTWYMSRKPIKVIHPENNFLEEFIIALFVEQDSHLHRGSLPEGIFFDRWRQAIPGGVELGLVLSESGILRRHHAEASNISVVYNQIESLGK